jgi:phytoene dehydrogenase-like protein
LLRPRAVGIGVYKEPIHTKTRSRTHYRVIAAHWGLKTAPRYRLRFKRTGMYDAIIIGSGPNGLAAAIELARQGSSVLVREGASTIGGSCRSAELTLPGYVHDICSTVAALVVSSPMMRSLPLENLGVELIQPPAAFAHPLDDGTAAVLERSVIQTGQTLGTDAAAWSNLMLPLAENWSDLAPMLLAPPRWPAHPLLMAKFGLRAIRSARGLANSHFNGAHARALFAGAAAHAIVPLEWKATASFGLVLTTSAHADGWPIVRGGMQKLAEAMATHLRALGGQIMTDAPVGSLDELPAARSVICDITPRQLIQIAGKKMPDDYRRKLERFRYGPGIFKMDWALSGPIPWKASACTRAATVHLGGTFEQIDAAERAPWRGEHSTAPYVLLVQPTLFDATRAPPGRHTAWAYCHVPSGSSIDMTHAIESQVERFAPGFGDLILARNGMNCAEMERRNPNLIGGDITGGAQTLSQLFTRPTASFHPYRTAVPHVYLCSASTPPGGGVHGMCGYHAARTVISDLRR